ncbi:MAG: NAD(+) diphosphatase [Gammaproteobacteria bacterium]
MLKTPPTFVPLLDAQAHPNPLNFIVHGSQVLLRADGSLPEGHEALAGIDPARLHPVGLLDDRYCQTAWMDADTAPPGFAFTPLRGLLGEMDDALTGVAARAVQIAEWARTHQFCGACGSRTAPVAGERCFKCQACGFSAYPRISPAMMVLIRKGEQMLLAQHVSYATKRHTPLAGFLEAGETVEEAIHREVFEEVGLRVHKLRYFGSQSWPFPHSLMLAFTAEYLDGEIRVDPNEIADARWFGPDDEWERPPQHISISTLLVEAHRRGQIQEI